MADLDRLGIRIEAHGDRLRYSPRSLVTPDLIDRMKARKGELLAILRDDPQAQAIDLTDSKQVWQAALDRLEGSPSFPPDVMEPLRAADARWADDSKANETDEAIDPPDPSLDGNTGPFTQHLV